MPIAPYIAFAIALVVTITGTPESSTACGNALPLTPRGSGISFAVPFTYTYIAVNFSSFNRRSHLPSPPAHPRSKSAAHPASWP